MNIRLTACTILTIHSYDEVFGETELEMRGREGSVFAVGEVSPCLDSTTFELVGLGWCEIENSLWVWERKILFSFDPERENLN